MKILLQHADTRLFLGQGVHWVREKEQAKAFPSTAEAIQFCLEHRIQNADILLAFTDSQYDVRLKTSRSPDSPSPQ